MKKKIERHGKTVTVMAKTPKNDLRPVMFFRHNEKQQGQRIDVAKENQPFFMHKRGPFFMLQRVSSHQS